MRHRNTLVRFAAALGLTAMLGGPAAAKYAAVVIDVQDGKLRHAVNADTRNFPASLTKLMTLYLLFDAIDSGKLTMDTRLAVSARAARQPSSRLGLRRGQSITVKQAILALVVKSANDVASVVAESLGGTERKFALKMTAKARKIGMSQTTFRNASGLPHSAQLSTARDMATLARELITRFPHHYHYFSRRSFDYRGRTYRTHNNVLKKYAGADGMKTGYIRASGYNLISSASRQGHRVIGVIFGGDSPRGRDRQMMKLLDRAFAAQQRLATDGQIRPSKTYTASLPASRPTPRRRAKPVSRTARRAPAAASRAAVSDDFWGIQVGAFYSKAPAFDAARSVTKRLSSLTSNGKIVVMPLRKSRGRVLYRARILGIPKRQAYRACRLLKAKRKHCLELRLPGDVEIADSQGDR